MSTACLPVSPESTRVKSRDGPLNAARYRNYHPTLGRWIERDPAGYLDGPNLHAYVSGNPAISVDPSGLCGETAPQPAALAADRRQPPAPPLPPLAPPDSLPFEWWKPPIDPFKPPPFDCPGWAIGEPEWMRWGIGQPRWMWWGPPLWALDPWVRWAFLNTNLKFCPFLIVDTNWQFCPIVFGGFPPPPPVPPPPIAAIAQLRNVPVEVLELWRMAALQQWNTPENRQRLATILMSEASVGNDRERTAVGLTVLNRMLEKGESQVSKIQRAYATNQAPSQAMTDLAARLLSGEVVDTTGGATHFYSPRSMPQEGQRTLGYDTGGGLELTPPLKVRNYRPGWANTMEEVSVEGVRLHMYRFFRSQVRVQVLR
jgi:RHS repeat-associated protein